MELHLCEVGNERDEWKTKKACEGCHPDHDVHLTIVTKISKASLEAVPYALVDTQFLFRIVNAHESPQHRQKAEPIQTEVSSHSENHHGVATQRRPENARHI